MEAKKVLILAHKPPYPKADGGCIAIAQILESFLDIGVNVHFICFETQKHPSKNVKEHPNLNYKSILIDTKLSIWAALKNLCLQTTSYFTSRFNHPDFKREVTQTLNNNSFDLIVFESLFTKHYLKTVRKRTAAKLVYRSHNIEHKIWETQIEKEDTALRSAYLKLQVKRLKKEELKFWNEVDAIASISEKDSKKISEYNAEKTKTIGLHLNEKHLLQKDSSARIDFFHIGAMNWKPNQFGIAWLLDEVWDEFVASNSAAELHLAGKSMTESFTKSLGFGVYNHMEVLDATDFMNSHKVMLIPLFSGSGIRVKIIEGLALGKCIITTSIGADGISVKHRENILIADTTKEFAEQMKFCMDQPKRVAEIGESARRFAKANFSKSAVHEELKALF